ncbi:hypothetical protein SAMN05216548_108190 [Faunimonas pinastri]|uniref:Uncharacterized protein n=1 Tax=Faunimonas pinastri TaxID=1855383 RepID=A0A1H9JN29_9HYPH|nr:hypothetical protein [Faunimonas pinastri]SEQ88189.1 hypothetical protein SAMN05216548_108190 [Faunimonas pinastri]
MSSSDPKARADLTTGTLYAVRGESDWLYYGQVTAEKNVAFFARRDRTVASPDEILSSPIMAVVSVSRPSIGRALRSGHWKKLGRFALPEVLHQPTLRVQWPPASFKVIVWSGGTRQFETTPDDPAIQDAEVIAAWDAEHHIPQRLTADFGAEAAEWHVGGPVWRERRVREEYARRFPDQPGHRLPQGWVASSAGEQKLR